MPELVWPFFLQFSQSQWKFIAIYWHSPPSTNVIHFHNMREIPMFGVRVFLTVICTFNWTTDRQYEIFLDNANRQNLLRNFVWSDCFLFVTVIDDYQTTFWIFSWRFVCHQRTIEKPIFTIKFCWSWFASMTKVCRNNSRFSFRRIVVIWLCTANNGNNCGEIAIHVE